MSTFPTTATSIPELPATDTAEPTNALALEQNDGTKQYSLAQLTSNVFVYEVDCLTASPTITLTATDLQNIQLILIKNLDLLTGTDITIAIEAPANPKELKIINKTHNTEFGVNVVFGNLNSHQNNYYFAFESQKKTFFFDGGDWIMDDPPHLGNVAMTMFEYEPKRGYLNILDYTDPAKQGLFRNLNMIDPNTAEPYDVSVLSRRFFRDGNISDLQDDALQNITGSFTARPATIYVNPEGAFQRESLTAISSSPAEDTAGQNNLVTFDASRVARTDTETRPRNIAGYYIVKAW